MGVFFLPTVVVYLLLIQSANAFWKGTEGRSKGVSFPSGVAKNKCSPTTLHQARLRYRDVNDMLATLQDEESLVVMMFTSELCGPCRLQKKELKRLWTKKQNFEKSFQVERQLDTYNMPLKIMTIDMEKWPQVGRKFKVGKLPCLLMFQGGENSQRMEGLVSAEELWTHVERLTFDAIRQIP